MRQQARPVPKHSRSAANAAVVGKEGGFSENCGEVVVSIAQSEFQSVAWLWMKEHFCGEAIRKVFFMVRQNVCLVWER
jgi:hypothetical protein